MGGIGMAPVAGLLFLLLLFLAGIALIGTGTFVLLAGRLRASVANRPMIKPVAVLAGGVIALGAVVCLIPAFVLGMIRTANQDGYIETHQSAYRYNFGAGQTHVTYIEYDGVRYYDLERGRLPDRPLPAGAGGAGCQPAGRCNQRLGSLPSRYRCSVWPGREQQGTALPGEK